MTVCSYYGSLDEEDKPMRSFAQDAVTDHEKNMSEKMIEMEERVKRHITECKREVIKEIERLFEIKPIKENKNGTKSKGK